MSLLKIIKQQLGLSVTPANNFTLDASADNGTMKLARGNAGATTQDILTVDASGKVAFPQNVQTWQNVTGSRVLGTTYNNGTGQIIHVRITCLSTALEQLSITPTVAGASLLASQMYAPGAGYNFTVTLPVPPLANYSFTCSKSSVAWEELR